MGNATTTEWALGPGVRGKQNGRNSEILGSEKICGSLVVDLKMGVYFCLIIFYSFFFFHCCQRYPRSGEEIMIKSLKQRIMFFLVYIFFQNNKEHLYLLLPDFELILFLG